MKTLKKWLIAAMVLVLAACLFAVAACNPTPKEPEVTGIKVTSQPSKTEYAEGETFDPAGMVVKKVTPTAEIIVNDYVVDTTTPLVAGTTSVRITWGGFETSVAITVTGVEVATKTEGFKLSPGGSLDGVFKYRKTGGNWEDVGMEDVKSTRVFTENGVTKVEVSFEFVLNNHRFDVTDTVEVDFNVASVIGVKEFKEQSVGYSGYLNGYVIAIGSTFHDDCGVEFILKDKTSDEIIDLRKCSDGTYNDVFGYTVNLHGFEVGAEVLVPATLALGDTENSSDYNKLVANYTGSDLYETLVVSSGNAFTIDKSSAVEINTQAQLVDFLNANNRADNFYKVVRLRGEMNLVMYGVGNNSRHWRFFFDGNISKNAEQYIDGRSPVFLDANQKYTCGKTFTDLAKDNADVTLKTPASNDLYDQKQTALLDVYALFIGGNNYYHEFVILDQSWLQKAVPNVTGVEFVEPDVTGYLVGEQFSMAGAKVITHYDFGSDTSVEVTEDMITSAKPNMSQKGSYVVSGKCGETDFTFTVRVSERATNIVVNTQPSNLTYGHRQGIADVTLEGGILDVTYADGTSDTVEMKDNMLPNTESPDWKLGQVTYTCTYLGATFEITVTYENRAMDIATFNSKVTQNGNYDVTGVIVGPVNTNDRIELLIKDKNSMNFLGIGGFAADNVGSGADLKVNFSTGMSVGDEIIVEVARSIWTTGTSAASPGGVGGRQNHVDAAIKGSYQNIIIVSKSNEFNYDLSGAVEIDSQNALKEFITARTNFYKVIKLNLGLVRVADFDTSYRFTLQTASKLDDTNISINGDSDRPVILNGNTKFYLGKASLNEFLADIPGAVNPRWDTAAYGKEGATLYMLYVGGNRYCYVFTPLAADWYVAPAAAE